MMSFRKLLKRTREYDADEVARCHRTLVVLSIKTSSLVTAIHQQLIGEVKEGTEAMQTAQALAGSRSPFSAMDRRLARFVTPPI